MRSCASFIILLFLASIAAAHPGRTDGNGGHYVRTAGHGYPVGSYHYHTAEPSYYKASTPQILPTGKITYSGFSREDYKLIQQDLKQSGFYGGSIDGVFGSKSLIALKSYQTVVNKSHLTEQQMLEAILRAAKTNVKMQSEAELITPEINNPGNPTSSLVETGETPDKSLDGKLLSGKTYVPIREISEAMGAKLEWNAQEKAAYLMLASGKNLKIANQAAEYSANSLSGKLVDGKTYVPLREISEAIGASLEWSEADKSACMILPDSSRLRVKN